MSSIIRQLITELAGGAPGAVDAGPLSLEILGKKEKSIKNKKAMPLKLIKYDDDDDVEQDDSDQKYSMTDELDPDFDDSNDDLDEPGDFDDMSATDDEPGEKPGEEMTQMFQQFKQWLIQNSDLVNGSGSSEMNSLPEPEMEPQPDESEDSDMGMGMYSTVEQPEENEEPEEDMMGDDEYSDDEYSDDSMDEDPENQDPNRQGIIRTVSGSHLVYKREQPDGFYEEMWFYNIGKNVQRDELEIKKDILSGTDIKANQTVSDDGAQSYDIWSVGNGQMMRITGIPN